MAKKTEIQIVPAKAFEIKKNRKYLIIMPINADLTDLDPVLKEFFGSNKVLVLAVNDVNEIKLTELLDTDK